jgi:[acyl-carrier-protein] S-malonyltransferase
MKKIGMIFPGQGSQFVGMGKQLYDRERVVQELFEQANGCLDINFVKLCFASSEKDLQATVHTQTAIFLVSAAIAALLKEKYDIIPQLVAGHSLGEYTAIHCAGGMNFVDSLYLLKKRGEIMEQAMRGQNGGMLAVLGFPEEKLRLICEQYDQPDSLEFVAEVVNFNSPTQLVVSGTMPQLEFIKNDVETFGGKAVMLPVSGAFHSRLMKEAERLFSVYLTKADFHDLKIPLVENIDAQIITTADEIKKALVGQTSGHILWWASMQHFKDFDVIVEIGPNDKFAKMIKREWPEKMVVSVNNHDDIHRLLMYLDRPIPDEEFDDDDFGDLD